MKFLLLLSSLMLLCLVVKGTSPIPKDCKIADRILEHGESGPAELGKCELVECKNGKLSTLMHCGLTQLGPNCPRNVEIRDLTKLYPDCCVPPCNYE